MKRDISRLRKRYQLGSGLVLGVFITMHFLNHALGLISLEAMEAARGLFNILWRSIPGTVLLYGSLLTHFILALDSLYHRQTLRMPMGEAIRILSGLGFPFLIVGHVVATRIELAISGYEAAYPQILRSLWSSALYTTMQSIALLLAWGHGCLGIWFWLRGRDWFPRYALLLYTVAWLVPLLSLLGFFTAARIVGLTVPSDPWFMAGRADVTVLSDIRQAIYFVLVACIGGTLIARALPTRGQLRVRYPDGRTVTVAMGFSVLEVSRAAGIPHLSVCGGRGRCSTCRVRVTEGLEGQPKPREAELATLQRIRAPANVRLACQLRPSHDLTIAPVLGADSMGLLAHPSQDEAAGRERPIAVLFCDLRDFTHLAQEQLPFDTVFLLNRYFETIGEAVEGAGGTIDKFIGDGALALFGLNTSIEDASAQALTAAVRIAKGIEVLNRSFMSELDRPLRVAMGMHSGPAIIGQIGYGRATSLTAVGDTINAASRLEGFAKEYDAELAVSADLVAHAGLTLPEQHRYNIAIRGRAGTLETLIIHELKTIEPLLPSAPDVRTKAGR